MPDEGATARLKRLIALLPPTPPPPPVLYTPGLLAYVGMLVAASLGIISLTVRAPANLSTLVLGVAAVGLIGGYPVRTLSGVDTVWAATGFIHLGMTFVLGPVGALAASITSSVATLMQYRSGWFRMVFNVADAFLADMAAWAAYSALHGQGDGLAAMGALAGGGVQWLVNHLLLGVVVKLSTGRVTILGFLRQTLGVLHYNLGYGWAAFGFVLLEDRAGTLGFSALLTPVLLLQGFLIFLARRVHVHEETKARHAREREELLQRIIDASEHERRRIASDLHDGVVQNLAGAAFTLSARAKSLKAKAAVQGAIDPAAEIMERVAHETRDAMRDLRTLIIQIAPPHLDQSGLERALTDLLAPFDARGIQTHLAAAEGIRLGPDLVSLIFRVAQEALRNVTKYAEPTTVSVTLENRDEKVSLTIQDDGKGFSGADIVQRSGEGHVGLSLLANAVQQAGGVLTVASVPGEGTTIRLEVQSVG